MTWIRLAVCAAMAAAVVAAGLAIRAHLVGIGETKVQAQWDAQKRVDLQASLDLQREANAERLRQLNNSERNADEQARREAAWKLRDDSSRRKLAGLRATIDRLNGRDVPRTCDAACIAALAREASTARELLGSCGSRYRDLAARADELTDQVIGLQADAQNVCRGAGHGD